MDTFITESITNKFAPSPRVIANSWEDAEQICPEGYIITGKWVEDIQCDESIAQFYQVKLN